MHDVEDGHILVAAASSTTGKDPSPILLWQWKATRNMGKDKVDSGRWMIASVLEFVVKAMIVLAAVAYVLGWAKDVVSPNTTSALSSLNEY